ncbi:hypothetical protein ACFE04_000021 [Oxalis oulophora]
MGGAGEVCGGTTCRNLSIKLGRERHACTCRVKVRLHTRELGKYTCLLAEYTKASLEYLASTRVSIPSLRLGVASLQYTYSYTWQVGKYTCRVHKIKGSGHRAGNGICRDFLVQFSSSSFRSSDMRL